MSSFTEPLIVRKVNRNSWMVERQFVYFIGSEDSKDYEIVPRGFLTDFASVPRIFWAILPPDGTYTQASVLHDYLYNTQERPRKECDDIFLESMVVLKVKKWKRRIMYKAVRLFGGGSWKRKTHGATSAQT